MFYHKKIGRWHIVYRKPYKKTFFYKFGQKLKNTPSMGIWRFGAWRTK
jgi:hypothetical protein